MNDQAPFATGILVGLLIVLIGLFVTVIVRLLYENYVMRVIRREIYVKTDHKASKEDVLHSQKHVLNRFVLDTIPLEARISQLESQAAKPKPKPRK